MTTEGLLLSALNWVEVVLARADSSPDESAYTFLLDGEGLEATLTSGELDRRARAVAVAVREFGAPGDPVLLLHPPGLDYVIAVCGYLYAGMVAVPAYPPDPTRLSRTLPRLVSLVEDAGAKVALTTAGIRDLAGALFEHAPQLGALRWLASDAVEPGLADAWRAPALGRNDLALLQYTSGSTAAPRGVMLSHGNLLHNSWLIHRCFGHGPESRGVIWLPPYHDMGLIGGVLQPLCGGFPVVLMSPLDFLARPLRWLRAVSRHRATTSGGPNFAYDLCARKVTPAELASLDLSGWGVAFNGAEPMRQATIDRFCEVFAPAGFRREAFYPCYGLAEGTLIASGGVKAEPPVVRRFGRAELAAGRAAPGGAGAGASSLVSSGRCLPDQRLLIVAPETGAARAPGEVGEVWLAGPSVALGYWGREGETKATFGARAPDGTTCLRTGDSGFLDGDGELFVVGRRKGVIIRGQNQYPQDLERTVEHCHPAARPGCSAAFALDVGGDLPLSFAQLRLWFLQQLAPESSAYHLPVALDLVGELDEGALAPALDELVRRYEALRTTFHATLGEPTQRVREHRPAGLPVDDLSGLARARISHLASVSSNSGKDASPASASTRASRAHARRRLGEPRLDFLAPPAPTTASPMARCSSCSATPPTSRPCAA